MRRSPAPFRHLFRVVLLGFCLPLALAAGGSGAAALAQEEESAGQVVVDVPGSVPAAEPIQPAATAVINVRELAREAALHPGEKHEIRPLVHLELPDPAEPYFPPAPESPVPVQKRLLLPSPAPTISFMGLNDIAMVDSSYIIIPPDVGGAVGPAHVMCGFNNNYRIFDKATGAPVVTLGTATFWAPVVAASERLSLTDPRTLYDPYNNCWVVAMQTFTTGNSKILVGVSQTSDPTGAWNLYSYSPGVSLDFPNLGFNKNWITVAINRYTTGGTFSRGITLIANYAAARAGTGGGTIVTQTAGTHFCSSPCVTYSATQETLYVVTHLSSSGATYALDTITGTASAPVYTSGGSLVRTGGGWAQPSGNILPQSAPVSGTSACGATPCPIEVQDSQVRSAPVWRGSRIWYAQTIGLPSTGLTHTGVQWTRIATPGGAFVEGGRLEDPTATSSNGGLWYAYPHIAANAAGDYLVGYSQFSSAQHPAAGYSLHLAADGAGTIRDPLIYHAGEDYYHKTFSTTTGRNRWGDFSAAQVDPVDDSTLWTLQEYAKARPGTDDGNSGSNSSRWSSWWAGYGSTTTNFTITASAGAGGTISPSGSVSVPAGGGQTFTITPNACYHVADVLVDGSSVGAVTSYPFTNVTANHTIAGSFAINTYTITASAGTGGTITPSGSVGVNCGSGQTFAIAATTGYHIADVLVDGGSVGAVASYNFPAVTANHTIAASFSTNQYTLTTAVVGGGTLSVVPQQALYDYGTPVQVTANAGTGWAFDHWTGDASGSANPLSLTMTANLSVTAVFLDVAPPTISVVLPNGGEVLSAATIYTITWTAADNAGVTGVDLALSTDSGASFPDTIRKALPNSGSYDWTVPNLPTLTARVRAVAHDAAGHTASDESDADFQIRNSLTAVGEAMFAGREGVAAVPNPAREGTVHVYYAVKKPSAVELSVYDVSGRLVRRLRSGSFAGGVGQLRWDGADANGTAAPSGVYFVRMRTGGGLDQTARVVLVH